jgi:hypothetical protein
VELELTWWDPLLMVVLAAAVALGVRRGVATLIVAVGSLLAWFILNIIGVFLAPIAFLLALGAGYGLGVLSRSLINSALESINDSDLLTSLLGGLGGLLLGLSVIAALTLSFPTSPNSTAGRFDYPSTRLPVWLYNAVEKSAVQRFLRNDHARGGLEVWGGASFVRGLLIPDKNR